MKGVYKFQNLPTFKAGVNRGNFLSNITCQHLLMNMLTRFAIGINMLTKKKNL